MKIRHTAAALMAALVVTGCNAGYQGGLAALRSRDYPAAIREFRVAADQGDAAAQFYLGMMYMEGRAWRGTTPRQ